MELSELHDCEKCREKMVGIRLDNCGNTYCGYCGERVDYSKWFKEQENKARGKNGIRNSNSN